MRIHPWSLLASLVSTLTFAASVHAQPLQPPPSFDPNTPGAPGGPPPTTPQYQQPRTRTEQELAQARREDSGRDLEFVYVNAGGTGSFLGLNTLSGDLPLEKTSGLGGGFDAGAGLRLLLITLGPRFRFTKSGPVDLFSINGEGAFHIPLGEWDPYVGVHGGYSFGKTSNVPNAATDSSTRGANVGLQVGTDYYLSSLFSVGGELSGELLILSTKIPNLMTTSNNKSLGLAVNLALRVGLHF